MKAPTSSGNFQLLLPSPKLSRRIRSVLYAMLAVAAVGVLLWLVRSFFLTRTAPTILLRQTALVSGGLLLLGTMFFYRRAFAQNLILRKFVCGIFSRTGLGCLLALPALRLFYVLALDVEHSLQEIMLAYWYLLAEIVGLALCLLFRVRLGNWIDSSLFQRLHQQEAQWEDLLDAIKLSSDLPDVAQRVIQTINVTWQPEHVRILFAAPELTDYYFSVNASISLAHLPTDFPLQALFEKERFLVAPFRHNLALTETENTWLKELRAQTLLPLAGSNTCVVGLMALGAKKSEAPYLPDELDLLFALARQIAFVSERAPHKACAEQAAQAQLSRLARLEAAQRIVHNRPFAEETNVKDHLLVQEHLNDLPQRQEVPARVG